MSDETKEQVPVDEVEDAEATDNVVSFPLPASSVYLNPSKGLERLYHAVPRMKEDPSLGIMDGLIIFCFGALDDEEHDVNEDDIDGLLVNWWQTPVENLEDIFVEFLFKRGLAAIHLKKAGFPSVGVGSGIPELDIRPYIILGNLAFREMQKRRHEKDPNVMDIDDAYVVWLDDVMGGDADEY